MNEPIVNYFGDDASSKGLFKSQEEYYNYEADKFLDFSL